MDYQFHIGGKWQSSTSDSRIEIIDPASEDVIATTPRGNAADVNRAVQAAHRAFQGPWSRIHPGERGRLLAKLAAALEACKADLAEMETRSVGRPLRQSVSNVKTATDYFYYYAGAADKLEGDMLPVGPDSMSMTMFEPLGVTGHIVPWNLPIGLLARSLAPALAAGNTAVVKPPEHAPSSALRLAELCMEVGFPEGVVNVVTGYGPEAGMPLVQHPLVRGLTFTGSVATGKAILRMAADGIKPVIAELGGKNPQIIFPDADLDKALTDTIRGGFSNAGQVCSSASRILVHCDVYGEYSDRLRQKVQALTVGPGLQDPDVGPLISTEQLQRVSHYVQAGINEGAQLLTGGGRPQHLERGYFIEPAIFDRVDPRMSIAQDEIFGPVICTLPFETIEEAVELANGVAYGLVAGVYTQDISRALRLAREIQAGQVWINDWAIGGVLAPFGGYKDSGLGREKGMRGLMNYVQIKNVGIRL